MDRLNEENVLGYEIDDFKNFMVRSSLCIKWNVLARSYDFMCVNILVTIIFKKILRDFNFERPKRLRNKYIFIYF